MAQYFTMRFAFYFPERSKGIYWSGPYQIPANSVTEAKDILTTAVIGVKESKESLLYDIRLIEVENRMKPGRAEEHYAEVSIGVKEELWRRELRTQFQDGVPKPGIRSLDDSWTW